MVRDAIEERMQEQVDELEEEQQRDERKVLDGLGADHRRATEDQKEDPEGDYDQRDDAELDVAGALVLRFDPRLLCTIFLLSKVPQLDCSFH